MAPPHPPSDDDLAGRLKPLVARCEERGLPVTGPRRAILETVLSLGTHPTADEVHAAAAARLDGVGRATVYRALEAFVRAGVLTKASHTGTAVRYDATLDRHHHLVCLLCDEVIDIRDHHLDAVSAPDTSRLGFVVQDVQVQLRGICQSCRAKEDDS